MFDTGLLCQKKPQSGTHMKIKDIINFLEAWASPLLQENYDNSGLIVGDKEQQISESLITLDVTEEVIDEAIQTQSNLIIAHHPLIFSGIKRIGTHHWVDKCIRKVIKHDINIYVIHTNLDNIHTGVNRQIANKIGLTNVSSLKPKSTTLSKLVVFVPSENKQQLLEALYAAGAGEIGNYDHCSFQTSGEGTFRPGEASNPVIGLHHQDQTVKETRIEVILPHYSKSAVLQAMRQAHPYEEVAYYLTELQNTSQEIGSGMIGELQSAVDTRDFLISLKEYMQLKTLRHTSLVRNNITRIAICGGSGSFLLSNAIAKDADIFITSDFKYHDFFEANGDIIIADIGHYESEVFTKELIQEKLSKKFTKFAFRLSEVDTNPIKYL